MRELMPVVSGRGRPEDTTSGGWGVVLDSVEVQDIRVLSEEVFRDMQAVFRSELAVRAREAELNSAQAIATREASSAEAIESAKITSDTAAARPPPPRRRTTRLPIRPKSDKKAN